MKERQKIWEERDSRKINMLEGGKRKEQKREVKGKKNTENKTKLQDSGWSRN
jgi:hypothetical protein